MNKLSRREAIHRVLHVAAATGLPFSFTAASSAAAIEWPAAVPAPLGAAGYGTDPDLIHPAPAPWPLTLTPPQRHTLSILADIIVPAEGNTASASATGAVDVLDEWVSAPYPTQAQHRQLLLPGLVWLDSQAAALPGPAASFAALSNTQQLRIIDTIAYPGQVSDPSLSKAVEFFSLVRQLVVAAFYTSPAGTADLGYMGNVAIAGDYPGPTPEAAAHLKKTLKQLGLTPAPVAIPEPPKPL